MNTKRQRLVTVAEQLALKPFHGKTMGLPSNLKPITDHFPNGPREEFEGKWCAAFVYHCCIQAGFEIPYRYPNTKFCSFAGVWAWLQWAKLPENRFYFASQNPVFLPEPGDLVIYDRVFDPGPHDHIGILLSVSRGLLRVAEGNVNNISSIVQRKPDGHIRGYVRIPNDYVHKACNTSAGVL